MAEIQGDLVHWNDYGNVLLMQLFQLYSENFLLDTCLVCDQVQMFAHKAVLAAASPFFKQQLSDYGSGQTELRINSEILGVEITATEVEALLHFIYRGEVRVPHHRLSIFLELGRRLQVAGLHNGNQLVDFTVPSVTNTFCIPYQSDNCTQSFNEEPRNQVPIIPMRMSEEPNFNLPVEPTYPPPQRYIGVKSLENLISNDPPKLCEPLKVDTGSQSIRSSVCHTSFSDLCTGDTDLENYYFLPPDRNVNKTNNSYINGLNMDMPLPLVSRNDIRDNIPTNDDSCQPIMYVTEPDYQNNSNDFSNVPREPSLLNCPSFPIRDNQPLHIDLCNSNEDEDIRLINSVIGCAESSTRTSSLNMINNAMDNSVPFNAPDEMMEMSNSSATNGNDVIVEKEITNTTNLSCSLPHDDVENMMTPDTEQPQESYETCQSSADGALGNARGRLKVKDSIGGVSLHDTSQCHTSFEDNALTSDHQTSSNDENDMNETQVIEEDIETEPPAASSKDPAVVVDNNSDVEERKCPECSEKASSNDELTLHLWETHHIGNLIKCKLCDYSSVLNNIMVSHALKHKNNIDNECCICGKKLKTRSTLRNHLKYHGSEEQMFKCQICNLQYIQKTNLIKHLASAHKLGPDREPLSVTYKCAECSFTTLVEHKYRSHMARRHTKNKKFKCKECSYATVEHKSLIYHMRVHTLEKPYVCKSCNYQAATRSSLARHNRSHTKEKPYKCEECGQKYADSKRLRDHVMKHNNIKPFMCHVCGYSCIRKDYLQSHVKKCHASNGKTRTKSQDNLREYLKLNKDKSDIRNEVELISTNKSPPEKNKQSLFSNLQNSACDVTSTDSSESMSPVTNIVSSDHSNAGLDGDSNDKAKSAEGASNSTFTNNNLQLSYLLPMSTSTEAIIQIPPVTNSISDVIVLPHPDISIPPKIY